MSGLENQAKPIIEALMSGVSSNFKDSDREIAARWILKTAMVFEAAGGKEWFYTADERASVRSGVIPAGYTAFWAAQCSNLLGAYSEANNMFESAELSTSGVHGHVTTLAISTVAFQVITVRPSPAVPPNAAIRVDGPNQDPWPQAAFQLWPPVVEFHWPPSIGLNGELGLEIFANRFREPYIPSHAG